MPAAPFIPPKPAWADVAAFYDELRDRPLTSANLRAWIEDFSTLDAAVDESYSLAMIAYTANTADEAAEAIYKRWATEILPPLHEIRVALGRRMLEFADRLPDLSIFLRELRTDVEIFRAENLPRMAALEDMEATYDKIAGGLTVDWNGETKTVPELQPYLLDRDRHVRERAFRLAAEAYMHKRDEIAQLFHTMVSTRDALGREAGFANFRDYSFAAK